MALACMRRHRRWLYVFLWLVIAAFIILYIPALRNDQSQGTPAETRRERRRAAGLASASSSAPTTGSASSTTRLYQGRLDADMLRQLGLEEQVLEALVSERLVELEAKRLGITRLRRGGRARDRDARPTSRTTAASSARTRSGAGSSCRA